MIYIQKFTNYRFKVQDKQMCQTFVKNWIIVQVKRNATRLAVRNLERQGVETFVPEIEKTIKKNNKFLNKKSCVFPGYIFVGFSHENFNWIKINSTYGVSKILFFNNKPAKIPYDLIVALKKRYEANINPAFNAGLQKGDLIKFDKGPFADLIAEVEKIEENSRIWVLFEVLGGKRKIKIEKAERLKYIKL